MRSVDVALTLLALVPVTCHAQAQLAQANLLTPALVTAADYPASALRANVQGKVVVRFDVTEAGTAANCQLVRSSGSALLDATTCLLIEQRAHYPPARSNGLPRATTATKSIVWRLPKPSVTEHGDTPASPDELAAFADMRRDIASTATVRLKLGRGGGIHGCELTTTSGYEPMDLRLCDLLKEHGMVLVRLNTDGDPIGAVRTAHIGWKEWERLKVMKPSIGFEHMDILAIRAD